MNRPMNRMALIVCCTLAAMSGAALSAEALTAKDFVTRASEAGMAEVQTGNLAVKKAAGAPARTYGQMMVDDHGKANKELEALAKSKGLAPAAAPGAKHKAAFDSLNGKTGADFDAAYARQMVADHQEAVALFTQASALPDKDLAGFASKTLPTLKHHLEEAQKLDKTH